MATLALSEYLLHAALTSGRLRVRRAGHAYAITIHRSQGSEPSSAGFAALLAPDLGNATRLQEWITAARAADLPLIHAFTRGLDLDIQAVTAGLTLPFHNGRTEGVNTETMIKRQMYGRAGFALLRHRILLG